MTGTLRAPEIWLRPGTAYYGGIINFGDIDEEPYAYCHIAEKEDDTLTLHGTKINLEMHDGLQLNGNVGTVGQVLTSNGSNAAPTWSTVSAYSWDNYSYSSSGTTAYYLLGTTTTGTTSPGTIYKGYSSSGQIYYNSTGGIYASTFHINSDKNLKENITLYTEDTSAILELPVYKFDYINGAKNQIGCIAQELQEICPELVETGDNGYLTIQENKLVYLLLNEVKKLRAEINDLKEN